MEDVANPIRATKMNRLVTTLSHPQLGVFAVLAVGLIGWMDYATGFAVSFSVFYAVAIIAGVWAWGRAGGLFVAILAVAAGLAADDFSGYEFSSRWILLWNGVVRFCFYLLVVVGSHYTKSYVMLLQTRVRTLDQAMPVCSCCKRISDEHGAWSELEAFLAEKLSARPVLKVCPDCARQLYIQRVSPGADQVAKR